LYASLDVARMQMATEGKAILGASLALANEARRTLNGHPRLHCLDEGLVGSYGVHALDPTRLCVDVTRTGYTGYEVDHMLQAVHRVVVEMSDFANILANVTIGHTRSDIESLTRSLLHIADIVHGAGPEPEGLIEHTMADLPEQVMSPGEAFHACQEKVGVDRSSGRVSAEIIADYPPGIPVVVPGERLTNAVIEYLRAQIEAGCRMVGPEDPLLETVRVVVE
jgi:arginine decarboxylase